MNSEARQETKSESRNVTRAAGVVGAATSGRTSGFSRLIAFDMGGTSTDVARYDGDYEYLFEHQVGDAHLVATALAIESVAAGGGSICSFDGTKLSVGPESAGAVPGPACYDTGGTQPTVTDAHVALGHIDPRFFLGGQMAHAKGMTAILAPTINSYRRFVLGAFCPFYLAWGWDNRTVYCRVPAERGSATRVENPGRAKFSRMTKGT